MNTLLDIKHKLKAKQPTFQASTVKELVEAWKRAQAAADRELSGAEK